MSDKLSKNKPEECKAIMPFGDDHGDNTCTFRCMLSKGHTGKHKEWGNLYGKYPYNLDWEGDHRDAETTIWFMPHREWELNLFRGIAEKCGFIYELTYDLSLDGSVFMGWFVSLDGHALEAYYAAGGDE